MSGYLEVASPAAERPSVLPVVKSDHEEGVAVRVHSDLVPHPGQVLVNKAMRPLEGQQVPAGWANATFGPGQPVRPADQPWEGNAPREFDYRPQVNTQIIPRSGYNLMPFSTLTDTFGLITEVKLATHTLAREFVALFTPALVDTKTGDPVPPDHPEMWLCRSPDRSMPFDVWVKRLIQDVKAWDAACVYFDRGAQALRYVAGDTIFVMVDNHGRQPAPPDMAFSQVIQGTAMQWFSADELHYRPMQPQLKAPYGLTPIEDAWPWIQILGNVQGFELAFYTEGNTPEGFVTGLMSPDGGQLDPNGVKTWESALNAKTIGTGPAERRRIHVLPSEKAQWIQTKKADFPQTLYNQARDLVFLCFGVPPAESGSIFGRAPHSGMGGKGSGDFAEATLFRMGLGPLKSYVEDLVNIGREQLGLDPRLRFELHLPSQDMDQTQVKTQAIQGVINSVKTINEARADFGEPPVPGGDILVAIRNGTVVNVSAFLEQGQGPHPDGEAETDEAMRQTPSTEQDTKLAERVISEGKVSPGKTTSAPKTTPTADTKAVSKHVGTFETALVEKNTGVAEFDDAYFGSPCIASGKVPWPAAGHANDVQIVSIKPHDEGLPAKPGVWKPIAGEKESLGRLLAGGGKAEPVYQAPREQAFWLLDRALQFYCVPVAYVTTVNGQTGSVMMYSGDNMPAKMPAAYDPEWVESAAILDHLSNNVDRRMANWLTHPIDERRPILVDNGMTFPAVRIEGRRSPFVLAFGESQVSLDNMAMLRYLAANKGFFDDLALMVGAEACALVVERLTAVLDSGRLVEAASRDTASQASTGSGEAEPGGVGVIGEGDGE